MSPAKVVTMIACMALAMFATIVTAIATGPARLMIDLRTTSGYLGMPNDRNVSGVVLFNLHTREETINDPYFLHEMSELLRRQEPVYCITTTVTVSDCNPSTPLSTAVPTSNPPTVTPSTESTSSTSPPTVTTTSSSIGTPPPYFTESSTATPYVTPSVPASTATTPTSVTSSVATTSVPRASSTTAFTSVLSISSEVLSSSATTTTTTPTVSSATSHVPPTTTATTVHSQAPVAIVAQCLTAMVIILTMLYFVI